MRRLILIAAFLLAAPLFADIIRVANLAAGTTDVAVVAGGTAETRSQVFCGLSARETTGAAVSTFLVYNGDSNADQLIFQAGLPSGGYMTAGPWPAADCIAAPDGIFIDRTSGNTAVSVYYRPTR